MREKHILSKIIYFINKTQGKKSYDNIYIYIRDKQLKK